MEKRFPNMVRYNKRHVVFAVALIVTMLTIGHLGFVVGIFPIVILEDSDTEQNSSYSIYPTEYLYQDTIIKPMENINFDKVVLLLDFEDYDKNVRLPKAIPHRKVLWSSDTNVITTLKQSLWYYHGSDMCTVLSKILFFRDNRLIKSYYIVLEINQIGIQSSETGWIESTQRDELLSVFASFSPYHGILFDVNK